MGIVQTKSGTFDGTSVAVSLTTAPASTSLVVVIVSANTTITTTGWSVRDSQINFMGDYLLDRAGDGTTSSWTIPAAAGQGMWFACEIANGAYLSDVNNPTSGDSGATAATTVPFTALTPTAGTRSLIAAVRGIIGTSGSPATYSGWTGGFTEVADTGTSTGDRPSCAVATLEVTADGSTAYTPGTITASASQQARSSIIAAYSTGTGGSSLSASPSDPVGITDAVQVTQAFARTVSDNVGITDSSGTGAISSASPSDPVGITDTVTVAQIRNITISDNLAITDTGAPQALGWGINIDDPVGITDSASRLVAATPSPADSVGITDSATVVQALDRQPADPVGITDSVSANLTTAGAVNLSDPVGISDTITIVLTKSPADNVGITDSVTADLTAAGTISLGDPVGINDVVTLTRSIAVTISDAVGIADQAGTTVSLVRSVADAVSISDNPVAFLGAPPSLPASRVRLTLSTPQRRINTDGGPKRRLE